jgi:hypothetical protein
MTPAAIETSIGSSWQQPQITSYEENGEGAFTSDLSTSMFDFFVSFFASSFTFLASFVAFFDPLSFLAIVFSLLGHLSALCQEQIWQGQASSPSQTGRPP